MAVVTVPRDATADAVATPDELRQAAAKDSRDSTIGLLMGGIVILVGAAMFIGGFVGMVEDIAITLGGTEIRVASAPVGVVFALIGLAVVLATRPTVAEA
ncbi:MAG TPA: hypothetical protein VJ839_08075 [Candidatus Limnocylindria bacterium]|nr:hypothetical protein [Candidatus Limnocylindria bacterium]